MMDVIRTEQKGENLTLFFPSQDPNYDVRIVVRGYRGPFSLSSEIEEEIEELIHSVHRAVETHFSSGDPLGWGVCYDPKVEETLVIRAPDAAAVLDQYNGDYVKMEQEHRSSCYEGETVRLLEQTPVLQNVADAMASAYAKMAVENGLCVDVTSYRPTAPSLSYSEFVRPTAPSLSVSSRRSSLDQSMKNLFTTFNNASIALREGSFKGSYLEPIQWRDLLHPARKYGNERPVPKTRAKQAILKLVENPQSKDRDAVRFKEWLVAIASQVKEEVERGFVENLVSSLEGFYEESGSSQQAIVDEINALIYR